MSRLVFRTLALAGAWLWVAALPARGEEPSETDRLKTRIEELDEKVRRMIEEAEARKALAPGAEAAQEQKQAEEVLRATDARYTLLPSGHLQLEYALSYSYYSTDRIQVEFDDEERRLTKFVVEHAQQHTFANTVAASYGLFDNLTLNLNAPFVSKYEEVNGLNENDLGDLSLGFQWQPLKTGRSWPATTLYGSFKLASGKSPYEINTEEELSTGSGTYSLAGGLNLSKTIDPLVAFGGLTYTHAFPVSGLDQKQGGGSTLEAVDPGDTVSLSLGIGYALSYSVSLSLSYGQSYSFPTEVEVDGRWRKGTAQTQGTFSIGTGWRVSASRFVYVTVGIGLTPQDADFQVSLRLPVEFSLF